MNKEPTHMSCMCIQEAPGQYNEDVWEALDRVLDEARRAGLKVMLSFLDNWKYIGELLPCALKAPGVCTVLQGIHSLLRWCPS